MYVANIFQLSTNTYLDAPPAALAHAPPDAIADQVANGAADCANCDRVTHQVAHAPPDAVAHQVAHQVAHRFTNAQPDGSPHATSAPAPDPEANSPSAPCVTLDSSV